LPVARLRRLRHTRRGIPAGHFDAVPHPPTAQGLILFLVVAGIIVPLFHRARIGTVLGFLIAGVVLGPGGLGRFDAAHPWVHYITFNNPHNAEVLAEAGIVVMLFLLGLELSVQRLWQLRRYVLGVGLVQVALTTLAIGFAVRFLIAPAPAGLILGLCLALSSTAIVMQILAEQHRVAHPVGRIALSILLFQDLMVVPVLFIVGIFSGSTRGGGWLDLGPAQPLWTAVRWLVVIVLLWATIALLIRFAPNGHEPARWVTVGGVMVIVAWIGASLVYGWWVFTQADYKSPFGTAVLLLTLVGYLYTSAIVFLVGAQVDQLLREQAKPGSSSALTRLW
jgi:Kef-type K+ transport system membrane component KefB